LTINVRLRAPHTDRDSAPSGVIFTLSALINSANPGASRSITSRVASGVTSRGPSPVPPVVKIRFAAPASA
jgi:hypothetical protein